MWILKNSKELLDSFRSRSLSSISCIKTFDFSTLYTTIPHSQLKARLKDLTYHSIMYKNGKRRYKYLVINGNFVYFVQNHSDFKHKYTEDDIVKMLTFLIDNIFVEFAGQIFQQVIGIPMGTNCAPLLADLFLYSYEAEFIQGLLAKGEKKLAQTFNFSFRYIDDLLSLNSPRFHDFTHLIYPKELELKDTTDTPCSASYLNLFLKYDPNGKLCTRIYDKRDDFDFLIVNFPFLCSNIPASPAYGVYISQLIRYGRACSNYEDFIARGQLLTTKLLQHGYTKPRLKSTFRKFIGRQHDIVGLYEKSASDGSNEYDLVVIGGGSGGLACSKQAAQLGRKVAVLDYVKPSTQGTTWGLGGTCVNVGCIPKKLMHHAALLGYAIQDSRAYGWSVPENVDLDWEKMTTGVQNFVKSMNWGHRVQLHDKHVEYVNAMGSMVDQRTVKAVDDNGNEVLSREVTDVSHPVPNEIISRLHVELEGEMLHVLENLQRILTADNIVVAVGGRPVLPSEIPGAVEHAITSDDIFWRKNPPGKTLVIGGSYIALECGGFLTGMGYDTTVMVRSICLRMFDQQMSKLVTDYMENNGTKFLWKCSPQHIRKRDDGKLVVTYGNVDGHTFEEEFDTVMFAVGRRAVTDRLNLSDIGVALENDSRKIIGGHSGDQERSSIANVYGIGDVLHNCPELTPVAIKSGQVLANRLFTLDKRQMDYSQIPTTVFTPLEYGVVGMSEESAVRLHGEDNIEVYHAYYKPLEFCVPGRETSQCYIKAVCARPGEGEILGLHITGPNAGEILQGFAVALRCGASWQQICGSVGVHPTCAEEVVKMHITKRSGKDPNVTSC